MEQLNILVLDDDAIVRNGICKFLKKKDYHVFEAASPSAAFPLIDQNEIDIAIIDIRLPEMSGLEVLKRIKKQTPATEVIMITGHGDSESIITSLRLGAFDFFYKPASLADIQNAIERTSRYLTLQERVRHAEESCSLLTREIRNQAGNIIGTSPVMREVIDLTMRSAKSRDTSVLITGESGTGKELFARAIHYASERRDRYFFPFNCSAIPETLVESEFFGHRKGAFTGALEDKIGGFEAADGGTLFLDEIGDMPMSAQTKLLRVLEERTVRRIGSTRDIPVDVRIIAATNKNIKQLVEEKKFRLDLYYRLNTLEIRIPSLSERRADIKPLLEYFTGLYSAQLKKNIQSIDQRFVEMLEQYSFPGNVRELKNIVERAVLLCDSPVLHPHSFLELQQFPDEQEQDPSLPSDNLNLEHLEKKTIEKALLRTRYSLIKASDLLGISRYSLSRKMKKYGIE